MRFYSCGHWVDNDKPCVDNWQNQYLTCQCPECDAERFCCLWFPKDEELEI